MRKFYSDWKETIINFSFEPFAQYKVRLTEPFTYRHFQKKYISQLTVIDLLISSKGICLTVEVCSKPKDILIKPINWDEYWATIKFEHLSSLIFTINDDPDIFTDKMALKVIVMFKNWLTEKEQASPLSNNNFQNVAIAEPHLINGNVEFASKLSSNRAGKQKVYSNDDYQLYCWAKYYLWIDKTSYNSACKKAIKLHFQLAKYSNGTAEQERLRRDITKLYDSLKGLSQPNGCSLPPNNFF